MVEEIINRVNQSGLTQIDLEDLRIPGERVLIDIKEQLFQGIALREKDFREFIASHDWSNYKGKHVAVGCSEDAIIPTWAYMLLGIQLTPFAKTLVFGNLADLEKDYNILKPPTSLEESKKKEEAEAKGKTDAAAEKSTATKSGDKFDPHTFR